MKQRTVQQQRAIEHTIPESVLNVLRDARCQGRGVYLPATLARPLYLETNKVLELLGGKWVKGMKAHVFPDDPEQALSLAIMTGKVMDFKKTFQIFETPDKVADMMVEHAQIAPVHTVLEPSAGRGQILRAIQRDMKDFKTKPSINVCEMHDANIAVLARDFGLVVLCRDFMELDRHYQFNRIVMNPPFRNGQDVAHVHKAYDHLLENGVLVALTYPGWEWRTDLRYQNFRNWLAPLNHAKLAVPKGAFSTSGTEIETRLLVIYK